MNFNWIDDGAQLEKFCRGIDAGPLAVDTESDHFHAYQARVCLIQLAVDDRNAIIDPLKLDARELAPLFDLLEDPNVIKILHSARNDIIEIDRDYGISLKNLFDTQIAARFLDYERNSLTWMLEELLDVETGGEFKRFDWTTRPIPAKAKRYAVDDVRYLGQLRDRFKQELKEEDWFEAFSQQCDFVTGSVEYEANKFDPGDWRRIKGNKKLSDSGRSVLKALFLWRHQLCTELNRSAVTIFPNGVLFRLAKNCPTTREELSGISGIPRQLVNDHGEGILEVIADSRGDKLPEKSRSKRSRKSVSGEQRKCYHALRKWRNRSAETLGIPTEFIATNATLTKIAADPPKTVDELVQFRAILPWHGEAFGAEILRIVNETK